MTYTRRIYIYIYTYFVSSSLSECQKINEERRGEEGRGKRDTWRKRREKKKKKGGEEGGRVDRVIVKGERARSKATLEENITRSQNPVRHKGSVSEICNSGLDKNTIPSSGG